MIEVLLLGETEDHECYLVVEKFADGDWVRNQTVRGKKEWAKQEAELLRLKWLTGDE